MKITVQALPLEKQVCSLELAKELKELGVKQVCSLELAKELKELGVKQESLFNWEILYSSQGKNPGVTLANRVMVPEYSPEVIASAFTVAELINMFPAATAKSGLKIHSAIGGWNVIWLGDTSESTYTLGGTNLVDALAEVLIHLIKTGLVEVGG